MKREVAELFYFADNDLDSANVNLKAKEKERNVYDHCARAIEKYLKGYLAYKGDSFPNNHNLVTLIEKAALYDSSFSLKRDIFSRITSKARGILYKFEKQITDLDLKEILDTVIYVRNHNSINELRDKISEYYGKDWQKKLFGNEIFSAYTNKKLEPMELVKYDSSYVSVKELLKNMNKELNLIMIIFLIKWKQIKNTKEKENCFVTVILKTNLWKERQKWNIIN